MAITLNQYGMNFPQASGGNRDNTVGALFQDTVTKAIKGYYDLNNTDAFAGLGDMTLVTSQRSTAEWSALTVRWDNTNHRYCLYRCIYLTTDPDSNGSRPYFRFIDGEGNEDSNNNYQYSQSWGSSNDGAVQADYNQNRTSLCPITNWYTSSSNYRTSANGESFQICDWWFGALPNSNTQTGVAVVGNWAHRGNGTGETYGWWSCDWNHGEPMTGTNGQNWYMPRGMVMRNAEGNARSGTNTTIINVYGVNGFEETDVGS